MYFAGQRTFRPLFVRVGREVVEVLGGGVDQTVSLWCGVVDDDESDSKLAFLSRSILILSGFPFMSTTKYFSFLCNTL